jgi:hypothetical protein
MYTLFYGYCSSEGELLERSALKIGAENSDRRDFVKSVL